MLKHRALTQEDVASFPYQAGRPWCKLCSQKVYKHMKGFWGPRRINQFRWVHHFIKVGEAVVRCVFRNGTIGYYHQSCWDNPQNKEDVEKIKVQALS